MIGKTQDTVRNIVEAWMAERDLTRQQVLSILSELMRKHDLVAFGREHAVSQEEFRKAAERLEIDGETWDTVWFYHHEHPDHKKMTATRIQRRNKTFCILPPSSMQYVVFLKDLIIERESLRDSLVSAQRALPEFWFPMPEPPQGKNSVVSKDRSRGSTESATQARQYRREDRLEDLRQFSYKVYQVARKKQRPWALNAHSVPYTKKDFLEVFKETYPQHDDIADSTFTRDLKEIHTKFAKGKRSGLASTLKDLLKS